MAFALPFERIEPEPGRIQVGINVSGLMFNNAKSEKNEFGLTVDYAALTRQLIEALLAQNIEVSLFAHVADWQGITGEQFRLDDDQSAIAALHKEFPETRTPPLFSTASAAKSWMSGLDFVIAGRMHACIGAFSAGVPVVPIAYSRKFNGLFQSLGYSYFVDGKSDTTEEGVHRILLWFGERKKLREAVRAGNLTAQEKLSRYKERLKQIISRATIGDT